MCVSNGMHLLCRNDGPLKDVLFSSSSRLFKPDVAKHMVIKAKELLHPERGCLALIVEPLDIESITNMLKPSMQLFHSIVFGSLSPPQNEVGERDMRLSAFYEVSCTNLV
jgi:hypothetical protein